MEKVHFSIERVTSGKWFNFSETLFPSSETRANSPPCGSKKISRYKRALVQTEESIIGVSYDEYLLNKWRQRKRILVTLWIRCELRVDRFIRDEMKAQGRDWPKSIASGRQSCYHSVFLAGLYLCSLITALPPPPLASGALSLSWAAGLSFPFLPSKHVCPVSQPLWGLLIAIHDDS